MERLHDDDCAIAQSSSCNGRIIIVQCMNLYFSGKRFGHIGQNDYLCGVKHVIHLSKETNSKNLIIQLKYLWPSDLQ